MKIVALNGSHRGRAGCTHLMLDTIAKGAMEAGAEFETVVLAEKTIIPCIGCELCHQPDDFLHCRYDQEDDVTAIFATMKAADILIYATPVYIFGISGKLKLFLERFNSTAGGDLCLTKSGLFFHPVAKEIYSKPFAVLTCCGNIEPETYKNVISYFETFSRFLDAPIIGELVRTNAGLLEPGNTSLEEKTKLLVAEVLNALTEAGRELACNRRISSMTQKRANQSLLGIPFIDFLMNFRLFKQQAIKRTKKRPQ